MFEADIGTMLSTSKCIRTQNCFLYFHLGDPDNGPVAWLPLDVFKNAQGLDKAQVQVRGRTILYVTMPDKMGPDEEKSQFLFFASKKSPICC